MKKLRHVRPRIRAKTMNMSMPMRLLTPRDWANDNLANRARAGTAETRRLSAAATRRPREGMRRSCLARVWRSMSVVGCGEEDGEGAVTGISGGSGTELVGAGESPPRGEGGLWADCCAGVEMRDWISVFSSVAFWKRRLGDFSKARRTIWSRRMSRVRPGMVEGGANWRVGSSRVSVWWKTTRGA